MRIFGIVGRVSVSYDFAVPCGVWARGGCVVRSVAINIGANTNEPGFRGPIYPDGSFEFIPIPESEPTRSPVPTYGELGVSCELPASVEEVPVHLDPAFVELGLCEAYTYGDPYGVKARPLLELSAGDFVYFYASLSPEGSGHADWISSEWGVYIIGQFVLAVDPVDPAEWDSVASEMKRLLRTNAHWKRETFDAKVLLLGDEEKSVLFDRAVPLNVPGEGTEANDLVVEFSNDSGEGPWWRRPLRFDDVGTRTVQSVRELDPPVLSG